MAKRIRRTQILDAASGEILQESRETVYTSEAYIPGRGYRLYTRKHVRLGKDWDRTLKLHEWGWIVKIVHTMDENNTVADTMTLAAHLGVTRRRVYQILSVLKEHGAIAKLNGAYVVNPVIAFAGTYLSPDLYRLFQADLDRAVPGWAKQRYDKENEHDGEAQNTQELHGKIPLRTGRKAHVESASGGIGPR